MVSLPSVQAQNNFWALIDTAQREMVSITRHGRIAAYVMSPSVLDDYIEAHLALLAEKSGFASPEEVETFVQSLWNA